MRTNWRTNRERDRDYPLELGNSRRRGYRGQYDPNFDDEDRELYEDEHWAGRYRSSRDFDEDQSYDIDEDEHSRRWARETYPYYNYEDTNRDRRENYVGRGYGRDDEWRHREYGGMTPYGRAAGRGRHSSSDYAPSSGRAWDRDDDDDFDRDSQGRFTSREQDDDDDDRRRSRSRGRGRRSSSSSRGARSRSQGRGQRSPHRGESRTSQ